MPSVRVPARPVMAVVLAAAMAGSTVTYTVLGVLATFIIDDVGVSRARLGLLFSGFAAVGALLSPHAGVIADRLGGKRAIVGTLAVSGLGLVLLAIAPTFATLLAAVVVAGFAQSLANPSTNKLIATHYPVGSRGLVTGIKQSGVQAGTFLGGVAFPAIALAWGWRAAPALTAAVFGLMLAMALVAVPPDPPAETDGRRAGRRALGPDVRWLAGYALLMGAGGGPIFAYLPLYAEEVVGMSVSNAGLVMAVVGIVAVAARIGWSIGSEQMAHFSLPLGTMASMAFGAVVVIAGASALGAWALWVGAVLAGLSVSAWNSVAMLAVMGTAAFRDAGRASGVVLVGFLTGLGLAPPVFGWWVDRTGLYRPGFMVLAALFLAGLATMLLWRRRLTRDRAASPEQRSGPA